jgi:hypothetical protein
MPVVKIETRFEPKSLKVNTKAEATLYVSVSADESNHKTYWCECDINVKSPLSLAQDKELDLGRTRMGILKAKHNVEKQIKLFTRPNSYADTYPVSITAYLYDEDGAIAERVVQEEGIKCEL